MTLRARLLRGLLQAMDRALQLIVPPVRNRIGYGSIPDFSDNAYHMFAHALRSRSDLEHVWLLQDAPSAARVREVFARLTQEHGSRGHRLLIRRWHSPRGYWSFLRCRCVFHTHGLYNFSRTAIGRVRVGLWHGMPIKCIGRLNRISPNPNPQFATHHVATSWFFRYVLAQAFGVDAERVLMIGQPRNDVLRWPEHATLPAAEIRSRLGIGDGQRIVVWMPTYRAEGRALAASPGTPLRSFVDDIAPILLDTLDRQAQQQECCVLVKLHPYERADIGKALAAHPQFRVLDDARWRATGIALYDLLGISDALVSDVSSVLIDYVVSGKPVACLGFDPTTYTRDLVFPIESLLAAGNVVRLETPDDINGFFARIAAGTVVAPHSAYDWVVTPSALPASEAVARQFIDNPVPRTR